MKNNLVKDGYDRMADIYLANRDRLKTAKYVQSFLKYLKKNSSILDLGCGAGIPIDDILMKAGHSVIGLDISSKQIQLAKKYCRNGEYSVRDISQLKLNEYFVQGIVCMYTMFHLPRTKHLEMLQIFASYLPKGGMMLISMGDREFEGDHQMHGESMWSSQYGTAMNTSLVKKAGFEIILDTIDNAGGERHQIFIAQKL